MAGSAREQFDLRHVVDGTAASLLYPRSHVHMSTCPAFPVLPLESAAATALLTGVQRRRLLQAQEGNKGRWENIFEARMQFGYDVW